VGLREVHDQTEDDGGQDDDEGDSTFDPPVEGGDGGFEGDHAVLMLFGGEAGAFDLFGDLADLDALLLKLTVETGMSFRDLTEVSADTFGHGNHGGFGGFFSGGFGREVFVRHGDEAGDVRKEFKELHQDFGPHRLTIVDHVDRQIVESGNRIAGKFELRATTVTYNVVLTELAIARLPVISETPTSRN
jgi:hypothetical protein